MDGAPTTPPRRRPTQHAHSHLHKRTSSKIVLLSPPTPPHGAPSSMPFRISPESPEKAGAGRYGRAKLTPPPEEEDAGEAQGAQVQPVWMRDKGAKGRASGGRGWSRAKTALVACALVATVLLFERGRRGGTESAWWDASGGDERETYGRANEFVAAPLSSSASDIDPVSFYPAPPNLPPPPLPGAGNPPPPDRFRKIVVGKVHHPPPPPAILQDEDARMPTSDEPPRHNLEVTSATDPDTARKFLLVGWMGEQETKAQAHLYQLGLLALSLNRTLVLPSVKRSRFGTCYSNPFSLYYASDTFARFNIPYITADDFYAWTDRQRAPPPAQVVSFVRGERGPVENVAISPQKMCLAERNLDFSAFKGKAFFSPMNDWKSVQAREQFGEEVVRDLLAQERLPEGQGAATMERKSPAVLVIQYNLRYPFLTPSAITALSPFRCPEPLPYAYFPYSPHWTSLGHSIASSLSPFLAIHWRTETLEVDRLLPCGETLVRSIRAVKQQHPEIKTVYLATDYPIEVLRTPGKEKGATAHSGTMTKTLTPAHHAAMRQFLAALEGDELVEGGADGQGLRITTFMDEQRRVELPEGLEELVGKGGLEDIDGAIVGIVDKIVLMNAQLFYAGLPVADSPSRGCAKNSQFTTQVISGRRDLLAASSNGESSMWSEVEHFALPGRAGKARTDT
ncbi:hypothetical protein NBRC10512_007379 [Rhodotorula toruloides]|uniref:RHTO0S12e02520g1_1 n=2 Tax=Rhodotorula toruloides TaxID=5286 RepID=A0A061BEH5_RHOTO|nr:GDP-fucose protein O-fucosyltransferase family protein [Rhodotorula toruloides NP11]EMS23229.1 GDP-fucose protein O-fucosyltransferase family protein [Rhodotorula toruloides NP11]CDR46295.1 RHTO0S12e02520g1_1 [Rhodotorula toruloides]